MSRKIIIGFIVGVVLIGVLISLNWNKGSSLHGPNEVYNGDEQVLSEIEKSVDMALKSGGIHPEMYDKIDSQLKELERNKFEPNRIKVIRTQMMNLSVGGRTSAKNETSKSQPAVSRQPITLKTPTPSIPTPTIEPVQSMAPVQSCRSNPNPVFTHHITDVSKIIFVVPPPTIGAGHLKTHGYIGVDTRFPVYAPVDMILNTGAYYEGGPYWLGFEVSCEVTLRFGHVDEPIQAIKDVFPSTPSSSNDSRDQQIKNKISFKAGDLIGYNEGHFSASSLDFGVYNSTTSNRYKGNETWGNSSVYTTAICPFSYFAADLKSAYTSKFSSTAMPGNPRDGESFCN